MNADTMANVLDVHGTYLRFPRRAVRPWRWLYRRYGTLQALCNPRMMYQPQMIIMFAMIIGPTILALKIAIVVGGSALWLAWLISVWLLWNVLAILTYIGHVLWRVADLIGTDK